MNKCETCGVLIESGRFCSPNCKMKAKRDKDKKIVTNAGKQLLEVCNRHKISTVRALEILHDAILEHSNKLS